MPQVKRCFDPRISFKYAIRDHIARSRSLILVSSTRRRNSRNDHSFSLTKIQHSLFATRCNHPPYKMNAFLFLISMMILSLIQFPVVDAKVRGVRVNTDATDESRQLKKSGGKGKSIYYAPFMPQGEEKVFTVTTPLYESFDSETGEFDGVVGTYFLVVVVYNYDDKDSDGYVPINDAKITLAFDNGSFIISDGIFGSDPAYTDYAISGGIGKYADARGVMAIGIEDGAVAFSF